MNTGRRKRVPPEVRFWNLVDKSQENGCWIWKGRRLPLTRKINGKEKWRGNYGLFDIYVQDYPIVTKTVYAHRLVWEWAFAKIPEGMLVLHRCDTPPCVNPDHLFLGDNLANTKDCWKKGRNVSQTRGNPASKLTDEDARQIRKRRKDGEKLRTIADSFDVAVSIISRIANGTRRGDVK